MNFYKFAGACALALGLASGANAASLSVVGSTCGSGGALGITCGTTSGWVYGVGDVDRTDTSNVEVGSGDGDFFSLGLGSEASGGLGGYLLLEISPGFTGDNSVVEVTMGDTAGYPEYAYAYAGATADIGTLMSGTAYLISNLSGGGTFNVAPAIFRYLLLVDATYLFAPTGPSRDGFDVDSITVTEANFQPPIVPAPAAALLLGSAMGAFGLIRRRKQRA